MKQVIPSDTDLLTDFNGKPMWAEILCVKKGKVRFRPNGNPEGEFVEVTAKAGEVLPCEIVQLYETGTKKNTFYAIWTFA